jgi:hypothetical protein
MEAAVALYLPSEHNVEYEELTAMNDELDLDDNDDVQPVSLIREV